MQTPFVLLNLLLASLFFKVTISSFTPISRKSMVTTFTFSDFVAKYQPEYINAEMAAYRESIFEQNRQRILQHNQQNHSWTMALNRFADLTTDEFVQLLQKQYSGIEYPQHGGHPKDWPATPEIDYSPPTVKAPAAIDWRSKGVVPPVADAGNVATPSVYSIVFNIESLTAIRTQQKLRSLSLQQVVDCNEPQLSPPAIYSLVVRNGGLESNTDYPYVGTRGTCKFNRANVLAPVVAYTNATTEAQLVQALGEQGPVTVAVDASSWQFYSSGIFSSCPTYPKPNLVLLAVGYQTGQANFWILQNSWGADWGVDGAIWLAKTGGNECGLLTSASYPVIG